MLLSYLVIIYSIISHVLNLPENIVFFTLFLIGIYSGFIDWKKLNSLNKFHSYLLYFITIISLVIFFIIEKNITAFTAFTIFFGASLYSIYEYFINLEIDKNLFHNEKIQLESALKIAKDEIKKVQDKKIETQKELEKEQLKLHFLENSYKDIEFKRKILEKEHSQIKQSEYLLMQEKNSLQSQIRLDSNDNEVKKLKEILASKNYEIEKLRKKESIKAKEWAKLEKENENALYEINKVKADKEKLEQDVNQYIKEIAEKDKYLLPLQIKEGFLSSWINIEKIMNNYYYSQSNIESVKLIDQLFNHGKIDIVLKYQLHNLRKRRNEIVHNQINITSSISEDEYYHIQEVENNLREILIGH